ncbi:chemotaxis protein CheB [Borreliella burgdorferi]|uniref:Protein-glutamate methylesterase/protein-glutamine glutaminase n=4 Tax=Borreliella burgdorferi TaxID=139 RepID=CHEB_BORBU|nr:chemotaxis protein CheB [Borreliella burgdorferi]Q45047.2 RecName: Full=Protein-glutamate methylesterase/protein-glutamine glutaminase [Borreliella burgdorferi B31]AGS66569.1 chemotaxis response regulator protein-glutamate methylesterase [Borreliella burgdorferi CA382]EOA80126.1 chemotaxis response regulator protein-glutamate methylesterase [Borreliella burgdorferi CA8]AAC66934.1 chemotaxis response regulator protein-glutamate methylesterase [Borreliella burgdorferi B31]ACK75047.1 chemotaxi
MKILVIDIQGLIKQVFVRAFSKDNDVEILNAGFNSLNLINVFLQKFPDLVIIDENTARSNFGNSLNNVLNNISLPVVFIAQNEMLPNFGCLEQSKEKVKLIINKLNFKLTVDLFRSKYLALIKLELKNLGKNKLISSFEVKRIQAPDFSSNSKVELRENNLNDSSIRKSYRVSDVINFAPKNDPDVIIKYQGLINKHKTGKIIVVGSSTGGTEALRIFLRSFKKDSPPIIIVQHMPGGFTKSFAKNLNNEFNIDIKEAEDGDILRPGLVIIANGSYHLIVKYSSGNYFVNLLDGPLVSRHKPSVNVLFRSAAMYAGSNAIGVILTGMGDDGAVCMLEMKKNGAYTIAQDQETSVVFGMPMEAIKIGAVDKILPLSEIADHVLRRS